MRTFTVARCASGCAFHSTTDTKCAMCAGPVTAPQTVTRNQMLALIRNDGAYQAGKAAHLAALGITI